MTSWFEVLVVSSDAVLRDNLANILAALGIDAVSASTLHECGETLAQRRVALIFCDRDLADGNYQQLLKIRTASGAKPRVVVTSRTADWGEFKEAMRHGAFDVIRVPCRRTDVEWMVIQAKRAERQTHAFATVRIETPELVKAASASASGRNQQ
jgi:DNA-binding NtrC family response regulator